VRHRRHGTGQPQACLDRGRPEHDPRLPVQREAIPVTEDQSTSPEDAGSPVRRRKCFDQAAARTWSSSFGGPSLLQEGTHRVHIAEGNTTID
jgi:hypothetical protein